MYAVIKTGGKQYRISKGDTIKIEKLEKEVGEIFDFTEVLLVANGSDIAIGAPRLENAKVKAEILTQGKAKKVNILKFKRRKHHMKRQGHRQKYTEVRIIEIEK
jgi:large subunit ribosomal protein L21